MGRRAMVWTLGLFAAAGLLGGCRRGTTHGAVAVHGDDCVLCHADEYEATTSPVHAGLFGEACADCHEETAWVPATARRHAWPLTGAHARAACAACHAGTPARYAGTPTDCLGCHEDDLARARAAHAEHAGYSTACGGCHGTSAWRPATAGAHPERAFPITRGPHGEVACDDCHDTDLGAYAAGANTDCVGCHEGKHSRAKMDAKDEHQEARGYPRGDAPPNFCLLCHPDGRE